MLRVTPIKFHGMGNVAFAMPFTVGQVVQLDASSSTQQIGGRIRNAGALATVVELGEPFIETSVPGPWDTYAVMWHTDQVISELVEWELTLYVDPANQPGRTDGAFRTMEALRLVVDVEQPHAMIDIIRELDRARMYAEDCRSGNGPAYVSDGIPISWRTYAQQMRRRLDTADVLLLDARNAFDGSLEQMQDVGDEIEHFLGLDADGY